LLVSEAIDVDVKVVKQGRLKSQLIDYSQEDPEVEKSIKRQIFFEGEKIRNSNLRRAHKALTSNVYAADEEILEYEQEDENIDEALPEDELAASEQDENNSDSEEKDRDSDSDSSDSDSEDESESGDELDEAPRKKSSSLKATEKAQRVGRLRRRFAKRSPSLRKSSKSSADSDDSDNEDEEPYFNDDGFFDEAALEEMADQNLSFRDPHGLIEKNKELVSQLHKEHPLVIRRKLDRIDDPSYRSEIQHNILLKNLRHPRKLQDPFLHFPHLRGLKTKVALKYGDYLFNDDDGDDEEKEDERKKEEKKKQLKEEQVANQIQTIELLDGDVIDKSMNKNEKSLITTTSPSTSSITTDKSTIRQLRKQIDIQWDLVEFGRLPPPDTAIPFEKARLINLTRAKLLWKDYLKKFPDSPVDSTLWRKYLSVYTEGYDKRKSLAIVKQMKDQGITFDSQIYDSLIRLHIKSRDFEEGMKHFNEMKENSIVPSANTYGLLIESFTHRHEPKKALQLLEEAKKKGIKVHERNLRVLRVRCQKLGLYSPAMPKDPNEWIAEVHDTRQRNKHQSRSLVQGIEALSYVKR
jgi:pentatricopeptide repeat protein